MMLRDFKQQLSAIANSSKIAAYLYGVKFILPEIGEIEIHAQAPVRSIRPPGIEWNKFSYFTEVEASNGICATGFGEGNFSLLALQKSIAEGVERAVFRSLKPTKLGSRSSNGWAAHLTAKRAEASAMMELLERDAALLHWLTGTPLLEISQRDFPSSVSLWANSILLCSERFKDLRILISHLGRVPTVTTVLLDDAGFAVLSHATDQNFDIAIDKALSETCRIAHIALKSKNHHRKFDHAEDHALEYALYEKLPQFIFGEKINLKTAKTIWNKKFKHFDPVKLGIRFNTMKCGPLFVSRASSEQVQDLFFGETDTAQKNGWINTHRITEAVGLRNLNPLPHFVP
jgi:hypothetical protein